MNSVPYQIVQLALANLKSSIYSILEQAKDNGLTNVEIGQSLVYIKDTSIMKAIYPELFWQSWNMKE